MPSLNTKLASAPNTTANYVLKATTSTTIGNSLIFDNGTNVGIGNTNTTYTFDVTGTGNFTGDLRANGVTIGASDVRSSSNVLTLGGTSEIMRLNSTGVGIKTSSPEVDLQVGANSGTPRTMSLRYSSVPLYMSNTWTGTYSKAVLSLNYWDTSNGSPSISSFSNVNYAAGSIELRSAISGSDILFNTITSVNTAPTERMRITSGGQVQIKQAGNTFSDGLRLINTGNQYWGFVAGGDTNLYLGYNSPSASIGVFNSSTGTYTATSDINKKKDFEESTIGLNAILGLKPTLYRMKTEDETTEKHLGFIAQEVKEYIPQAYSELTNGDTTFIGLTEMPIVAALVKAIQELKAEVDTLKQLVK